MAKTPGLTAASKGPPPPPRPGAAHTPAATTTPPPPETTPKKSWNPVQFFREVRVEARKITWTSRQETWITSVMVFILGVVTALFFVLVDTILGHGMQLLLKFAA